MQDVSGVACSEGRERKDTQCHYTLIASGVKETESEDPHATAHDERDEMRQRVNHRLSPHAQKPSGSISASTASK